MIAKTLLTVTLCFAGLIAAQSEQTPEQRIDSLIAANLKQQKLEPNAPIDDATFLRRTYLSIAGRIPTIEEAEAFHSAKYPNKRERLIEDLLNSDAFASHFYNFWADILRVTEDGPGKNAVYNYQLWLKKSLSENMPYDQFVYELVSARGKTWENGATGYYHRDRGMPLDNMSNTVRIFLGTRLECAQCHNHPFDKWTQMDYYQMAAFSHNISARDIYTYAQNRITANRMLKEKSRQAYLDGVGLGDGFPRPSLERLELHIEKHSKNPRDPWIGSEKGTMTVDEFRATVKRGWAAAKEAEDLSQGSYWASVHLYKPLLRYATVENEEELQLPHDYQYNDAKPLDAVLPATMFGGEIDLANYDGSPIEAYAEWMTSSENPRFSRVIANRLWKMVFGAAIIEPVDDLTDYSQSANPELMAYLEQLMVELKYDMRAYLKVLFNTNAWQRAADDEEILLGQPYHFAGPVLRRMSAEQIWDSFVALCIPHSEQYKPLLKNQLGSIERERLMWTSLEGRDFDEYVEMLKQLAPLVNRQRSEETAQLSIDMADAKKRGDEKRYEEIKQELKAIDRAVQDALKEIGYVDLHNARKGGELLGSMMGLTEVQMTSMDASSMMGGDKAEPTVFTSLPQIDIPAVPEDLSKEEQRKWQKEQRTELGNFKRMVSKMARASELEAPAPRGHFLRDFGQSDRDVIENASDHASVPQALNLLNGPMIEALTNPFAVFGRRLHAAESSEERARLIFQAMLTRQPNEEELELIRAELEAYGEEAYDGLVWALLNTQRFLFVQ